jgi:hypothetical protein
LIVNAVTSCDFIISGLDHLILSTSSGWNNKPSSSFSSRSEVKPPVCIHFEKYAEPLNNRPTYLNPCLSESPLSHCAFRICWDFFFSSLFTIPLDQHACCTPPCVSYANIRRQVIQTYASQPPSVSKLPFAIFQSQKDHKIYGNVVFFS